MYGVHQKINGGKKMIERTKWILTLIIAVALASPLNIFWTALISFGPAMALLIDLDEYEEVEHDTHRIVKRR